jgi:amino acid permease
VVSRSLSVRLPKAHIPSEMVTLYPVAGAFTHYATRFLDPAFGKDLRFAEGIVLTWHSYRICIGLELFLLVGYHITW